MIRSPCNIIAAVIVLAVLVAVPAVTAAQSTLQRVLEAGEIRIVTT